MKLVVTGKAWVTVEPKLTQEVFRLCLLIALRRK